MRKANADQFECIDCLVHTIKIHEYYMVRPDIWQKYMKGHKGSFICIGCLEQRMGRRLQPSDFTHAPINHLDKIGGYENKQSPRLRDRLGKPPITTTE